MRGSDHPQTAMFSVVSIEDRIPADHPLRAMLALVNPVIAALSPRFQAMYSTMAGPRFRPSACCGLCSFKSSTPFGASASSWSSSTTTCCSAGSSGSIPTIPSGRRRCSRRIAIARGGQYCRGLSAGSAQERRTSVDCCRMSISPLTGHSSTPGRARRASDGRTVARRRRRMTIPGNPTVNFRKEKRSNKTHESVTDPECRLAARATARPPSSVISAAS